MNLDSFLVGQVPPVVTTPFDHISAHGLFSAEILEQVLAEFPSTDNPYWHQYTGPSEYGKMELSNPEGWPPFIKEVLDTLTGDEMSAILGRAFGIKNLVGSTLGGGLHCSPVGARLKMHTDFTHDPTTGYYRRLNLLIFLNHGWEESWGGGLYLGRRKEVLVPPTFGQVGVFATSSISAHGHPDPWTHSVPRRSIAVYYFSPEPPPYYVGPTSTVWVDG